MKSGYRNRSNVFYTYITSKNSQLHKFNTSYHCIEHVPINFDEVLYFDSAYMIHDGVQWIDLDVANDI